MTTSSGGATQVTRSPRYTATARRYWTRYRPVAASQLPDPEAFFHQLGAQIATAVAALSWQMQGPDWPGETHLEKIGRLNAAKMQAEEQVLAELLYSAPPELSPAEELQELLADLPSSEMISDELTQIDLDAEAQADLDEAEVVRFTAEQRQRKLELERLRKLMSVDPESISSQDAAARVQELQPYRAATQQ